MDELVLVPREKREEALREAMDAVSYLLQDSLRESLIVEITKEFERVKKHISVEEFIAQLHSAFARTVSEEQFTLFFAVLHTLFPSVFVSIIVDSYKAKAIESYQVWMYLWTKESRSS